jgi:DEAD/DEAH box helicase domain-containing protein
MMEDVLLHWDHLKRVESGVNRSIRDDMVESVLERRFLDALRHTFGAEALKPKLLPGARQAYQLNAGTEARSAFWTIETQVQIDMRFPGAPRKRVDFLLSPAGGVKASGNVVDPLPIVVEMDGLTNHAATAAEDIENRLGMIRTHKLRVWSLAWDDLSRDHEERVPNPFHERKLEAGMTGRLAAILQAPGFEDIRPHADALRMLQSAGSLDGLFACLRAPEMRFDQAVTLLSRILIGPTGKQLDTLPRIAEISEDGRIFLGSNPLHGHQSDQTLDLYFSAPAGAPGASIRDLDAYRVLLRGTLPRLEEEVLRTAGLSEAWRGLWRMINFLQDLRGFHVEFEGMEAVAAPDMSRLLKGADDLAWQEAETLADESFLPLLRELKAGGFIAPNLIGQDAMAGDAVIGMIELGWSSERLGLTEDGFEMEDWDILEIDPTADAPLSEKLDHIIARLNKKETKA